jgi:Ni,Fe-hydrogenase III small subunit
MTALGNAYYDIERFGISFVASPRHADILTVSGPVTRNMEHALKVAYEQMPKPRLVIAVGDGAVTGGVWKDSYAVVGPVSNVIPVDATIAGDPPSPRELLEGILSVVSSARRA